MHGSKTKNTPTFLAVSSDPSPLALAHELLADAYLHALSVVAGFVVAGIRTTSFDQDHGGLERLAYQRLRAVVALENVVFYTDPGRLDDTVGGELGLFLIAKYYVY